MRNQTTKSRKYNQFGDAENMIDEKVERVQLVKEKLLDGTIGAISVDACIFSESGYGLEYGNLKLLEQFNSGPLRLVFSEITLREIKRHLEIEAEKSKSELKRTMRAVGNYWGVTKEKRNDILESLFENQTSKEVVEKRLDEFIKRCGIELVLAETMLDIPELLKRYFDVQAPFESTLNKKSEFPDALALLTLQTWAKKKSFSVLFVTKDKGCKKFCDESHFLYTIDELDEALACIQQRDAHLSELCNGIAKRIAEGNYQDFIKMIETSASESIWQINWVPEAETAYYFESELQEVELVSAELEEINGYPVFRALYYRKDMLVVQTSVRIIIKASCNFSFFVKDFIDRDMVHIGDTNVNRKESVKADILITFENPNNEEPEVVDMELIPTTHRINFGLVEPDCSHEDPTYEKY
jgi:hypothetical protein